MIDANDLARLKNQEIHVDKNKVLIVQGSKPAAMYILLQGKISIFVNDHPVGEVSKPGSYLGEIAYILGEAATATCVTKIPCKLLKVTGEKTSQVVSSSPFVALKLIQQMTHRIADLDKSLMQRGPKQQMSNYSRELLAASRRDSREWFVKDSDHKSNLITLQPQEILITENTSSKFLFILKSGELVVTKSNLEIARIKEPGELIGEIAFFLGIEHVATCIATQTTHVIRMDRDTAEHKLETNYHFARMLLVNMARRLVITSDLLGSKRQLDYYAPDS